MQKNRANSRKRFRRAFANGARWTGDSFPPKKFSQNGKDRQIVLARIWQAPPVLRERICKRTVSTAGSASGALLRMARAERVTASPQKKFSQNGEDRQSVLARIWQAPPVLRERICKKAVPTAGSASGALLRMARAGRAITFNENPAKFAGKACADTCDDTA